jgi:prefoldin subunit 5
MKATEQQLKRMAEEVKAIAEDIAALQGGASLKSMGVPAGTSREEAIRVWGERKANIEAAAARGDRFAL